MPISFGNDFFGQVLGNTQDMLGDFMSQLPSYTDFFSVAPPTSTQLFGDQQNPFEIVPVPGDADPYGGVPYGGGDVGGEGGTNLGNQQQDAINRARYRTENPFGQPVNNPAAYGAGSSTGGGAPLAVPAQGEYQDYARKVAQAYGIDPELFVRQIQQESGFNPNARSRTGAAGIAQFMPGTAAAYGVNVNDPYSSLDGAARHMRDLLKKYGGDYRKALAAYNAGAGNVDKYGDVPPFPETQKYVRNIYGR